MCGGACETYLPRGVSLLQDSGPCNLGMPNNGTVYERYLWYVRLLTYNGFVVLIDNHLNSDATIVKDVNLWVQVRLRLALPWTATELLSESHKDLGKLRLAVASVI